jgi:hypothetical protein
MLGFISLALSDPSRGSGNIPVLFLNFPIGMLKYPSLPAWNILQLFFDFEGKSHPPDYRMPDSQPTSILKEDKHAPDTSFNPVN